MMLIKITYFPLSPLLPPSLRHIYVDLALPLSWPFPDEYHYVLRIFDGEALNPAKDSRGDADSKFESTMCLAGSGDRLHLLLAIIIGIEAGECFVEIHRDFNNLNIKTGFFTLSNNII